jgi:uncharacterized protein YndB with AHSA1/START domain
MKWVLIIFIGFAVIVALTALVGSRLPQSHRASRAKVFAVDPDVVWSIITDVEAFPAWREGVKRVERLPDRNGCPMWIEEGQSGKITFAVDRMERPHLLVSRIADRDLAFGGTWTYEITREENGSRLVITENGEVYNPLFRFMARFIFGYDATARAYLTSLDKRLSHQNHRS